jgi:outer membrane lipoprotein-sorting protein
MKSQVITFLILCLSCLFVSGNGEINHIQYSLEKFKTIQSYTATLHSFSENETEIIQYAFKKPGFIRMDFIQPHNGAALVYNPKTENVTLRPFGIFKPLVLTLNPRNPLITSAKGHTVDHSDIGSLLENVDMLYQKGTAILLGEEQITYRDCFVIKVRGDKGKIVEDVHRYDLWLDKETYLPVKVNSFDGNGNLIENVLINDLKVNVQFPQSFFQL